MVLTKGKTNQKNEGQIKKKNKAYNWMMKLKAKRILIKELRKKIKKIITIKMRKKNIWEFCNWRTKLKKKTYIKEVKTK
jgi:hypothetical protein